MFDAKEEKKLSLERIAKEKQRKDQLSKIFSMVEECCNNGKIDIFLWKDVALPETLAELEKRGFEVPSKFRAWIGGSYKINW